MDFANFNDSECLLDDSQRATHTCDDAQLHGLIKRKSACMLCLHTVVALADGATEPSCNVLLDGMGHYPRMEAHMPDDPEQPYTQYYLLV